MEFCFLLLLLFCSCSHDDVEDGGNEPAIAFSNMDASAATRTPSDLSDLYEHFIVRGEKTMTGGERQTVMEQYSVRWDAANRWHYAGVGNQLLKYWDLTASHYTFTAVTPDPAMIDGCESVVAISDDNKVSITNLTGNVTSKTLDDDAVEWMMARTIRTRSPLGDLDDVAAKDIHDADFPIVAFHDEVPLIFHPIFSKVDFAVYTKSGIITLKSFKVEATDNQPIKTRASYYDENSDITDPAEGYGHWKYTAGEEYEELILAQNRFPNGKAVNNKSPIVISSRIQLPQPWSVDGRKLRVTCETNDDKVYWGDVTITAANNRTNSWEEGVHYTYRLMIDTDEADDQVILFAVDMDKWEWIEGNTIEDIETNW